MSVFVWGLYDDAQRADGAVDGLVEGSFPPEEIRVHLRTERGESDVPVRHKTRAALGAAIGAALGALLASILIGRGLEIGLFGASIGLFAGAYGGLVWWRVEADLPAGAGNPRGVLVGITAPESRVAEASANLRGAGAARIGVSGAIPAR
jgi:hypothetical protein